MSATTWTGGAGNDDWYSNGFFGFRENWTNGVPVLSSTGTQSVIISGAITTQPVINGTENGAPGTFFVDQQGFTGTNHLTEIQIDGQYITLATGANLTVQGIAIGNFRGTSGVQASGSTISDLTAANGTLATYDTHMIISATGTDTLTDNDDSENFGLLSASGIADRLNITIAPGGHAQPTNTLYNYGLIEASDGGIVNISTAAAANGTVSALANPGWIEAIGGTFETDANIEDDANAPNPTGTPDGYIEIGSGGTALLGGSVAPQEEVLFLPGAGNNTLGIDGSSFGGVIGGIGANDEIDLGGSFLPTPANAADVTLSFNTATGVLSIFDTVDGTVHTESLTFTGAVPSGFGAAITGNGIAITDIPCFAAGTRILTPDGDVAVETLKAGDEVLTLRDGGDAVRSIIWAGRRTIDLARHPRPEKVTPVRILAGALGTGVPERDLVLSPDHCLYIEGHLIEAKTLVNGVTVIQDDRQRIVTYHHIELDEHDVVLAEGVAVETYLDSNNRQMFDGAAAAVLHPDFVPASRQHACAELVLDGPVVRAARQRLLDRALALGFSTTDQADLTVKAGIETLRPGASSSPLHLSFDLSQGCAAIELLSSAGVPAHLAADPRDRRRLGVAVTAIRLHAAAGAIEIELDDPAHRGLHDDEGTHRWTNGAARIALPGFTGPACLEIELLGQAARWVAGARSAAVSA